MIQVFITRAIPQPAIDSLNDAFGPDNVSIYEEDRVIPREILLDRVQGVHAILAILTETMDARVMDAAGPAPAPSKKNPAR